MKTKSLLGRKVQFALAFAIFTLLVVGALSYRGMVVSSESDRWVRHTHEVLESLQDLLLAMQSVESSYRGFVLTGKESYLESYHAGVGSAEQDVATVRNLTADNPAQQNQFPALEKLAAQKIQFGERSFALARRMGLEAAADAIRDRTRAKQIMDEYQGIIREMQEEELRLLVLRNADAKRRLEPDQNCSDSRNRTGLVDRRCCGLERPA